MLQAKLYNCEKYVGEFNIESEFKKEDSNYYLDITLYSILQNKELENIVNELFILKNEHKLVIEIHLNNNYICKTENLFIRSVTRTISTYEICAFSTKFNIISKQEIKNDKELYEKVIEDIEEDGYILYNVTIKEFDNYRLLELAYTKEENE